MVNVQKAPVQRPAPAVRLTVLSEPDEATVYPGPIVDRLVVIAMDTHKDTDPPVSSAEGAPFAELETLDEDGQPQAEDVDYVLSSGAVLSPSELLGLMSVAVVDAVHAAVANHRLTDESSIRPL